VGKKIHTGINTAHTFFSIKPNAFRARVAAWVLREKNMAMVWSNTILLHGVSEEEFMSNKKWIKHELKHVEQFRRYGTLGFLVRYLFESLRKGYKSNKYEVEAREAEELVDSKQ